MTRSADDPPRTFRAFVERHPRLAAAHRDIAAAVEAAGPLDARMRALVKIGLCAGARLETALRGHVRRALSGGATPEEIEQAILLGMNPCGFPPSIAVWKWAREEMDYLEA